MLLFKFGCLSANFVVFWQLLFVIMYTDCKQIWPTYFIVGIISWIHWLPRQQSTHPVDVMVATWSDYSEDFVHLKPVFHNDLVEKGQRRVLTEYLKALLGK